MNTSFTSLGMGEEDITTLNSADSDKIIVSQQPYLDHCSNHRTVFTWDPSQLEDLKFNLYRANFTSSTGRVNFYNPDLDIETDKLPLLFQTQLICFLQCSCWFRKEFDIKQNKWIDRRNYNISTK